jgi:hypothetical protein
MSDPMLDPDLKHVAENPDNATPVDGRELEDRRESEPDTEHVAENPDNATPDDNPLDDEREGPPDREAFDEIDDY